MRFVSILFLTLALNSFGQIVSAKLKVDGLTCSMCSKSVHKALSSLEYVDSILPNLETTSFDLVFKKDKVIDFNKIKDEVEGAGFSIGELKFNVLNTSNGKVNDLAFKSNSANYYVINGVDWANTSLSTFKLVDKGFVSKKEYKSFAKNPQYKCVLKPELSECKIPIEPNELLFHVIK